MGLTRKKLLGLHQFKIFFIKNAHNPLAYKDKVKIFRCLKSCMDVYQSGKIHSQDLVFYNLLDITWVFRRYQGNSLGFGNFSLGL